jgi:carboxyl-terminal processing protease
MSTPEIPLSAEPRPVEQAPRPSRSAVIAALFLVAIIGGGALFVSGFTLGRLSGATPGTTDDQQDLFRPFWNAYDDITRNYVGDIETRVLVEGAIKGMFQALEDPYSAYLTEEEYRQSLGGLSGEFEGVGIELTTLDAEGVPCATIDASCRLTITRVIRRSPAEAAGLREADAIVAVDGKTTLGSSLEVVVPTIRGPKGSTVVLTIEREGQALEIPVVRDVIQREDVHSRILADGRVGYLDVRGFSSGAAGDLHAMLDELTTEVGVSALILDLRDDPGGYVNAAREIASEFVGDGPLFFEQRAGSEPEAQQPQPGGVATDRSIPMVVLVNGGTASASEIVAAALQGNDRATLVGTRTFGKGTIQEFKELPGAGGYRLSVRKWLTPDQTWIHGVGLTPNVVVEPPAEPVPGADPVLERAIEILIGSTARRSELAA